MNRFYVILMVYVLLINTGKSQMLLEKEFGGYALYGESTTYGTENKDHTWSFGLTQDKKLISLSPINENESQEVTITPGAYQSSYGGGATDLYLEKRSENGTLIWNTFVGGEAGEAGTILITDNSIYVYGKTNSKSNIATPNTFMEVFLETPENKANDFIIKFDLNGNRIWGTYYRTTQFDEAELIVALVVDNNLNSFYILGSTESEQNVTTTDAFDTSIGEASYKGFLAKFDDTGNRIWSSYYGTSNPFDITSLNNISIDSSGNIIFGGYSLTSNPPSLAYFIDGGAYNDGNNAGYEVFLAKFNSNGERLWGLIYGGLDIERSIDLKVDSQDNIIWQGSTRSLTEISTPGSHQPDLGSSEPINGTSDSFLAKFDSNGQIIWATYYGGQLNDSYDEAGSEIMGFNTNSIALDEFDNIYFTSITKSENNISTVGTYQDNHNDSDIYDGFISKFSPNGERIWGTYFGGENNDYPYGMIYAGNDEFYIYGSTESTLGIATPNGWWDENFPANSNQAGFIMKFRPTPLSVEDNTFTTLALNPNPANTSFQINGANHENLSLQVFDMQGRLINQLSNVQTNQNINIDSLSTGMYLVTIKTENRMQTLKLVVE